jgi:hypothetical protein
MGHGGWGVAMALFAVDALRMSSALDLLPIILQYPQKR